MSTVIVFYSIFKKSCKVLVAQLCLTLHDPMDYSLPGSSVHGLFRAEYHWQGSHSLLQEIFPAQG